MKIITVVILLIVMLVSGLYGSYLGVNKYKHGCERIMNAAQTDSWLECAR